MRVTLPRQKKRTWPIKLLILIPTFFSSRQSDGPYSGHSSSNTLSSTASSGGHSDSDKWFELGAGGGSSGDQGESEPNGLGGGGYLQGASADSGIDTSSYGASHHAHPHSHHGSATSLLAPSGGRESRESRETAASPWHSPTEGSRRMLERSPAAAESPGPPGERSLEGTGRSPPTHLLVRDSSTFSLNEAGSHSRYV
ncbi:Signal-induced proliferation-associated 1-like protein 1 [Liparis tanakae]|uniref:Signal-induced proliferation-associated 1-like protein 1 n=1 Tax=Liparis tanakae TaxID=230148 RepID=A0A4Z2EAC5_9TELE|nr:Signal-induced proliferation-associated 1-like protein 1 [Liparis tanakae]